MHAYVLLMISRACIPLLSGQSATKSGRKQMKERIEELKAGPTAGDIKEYKVKFIIPAAARCASRSAATL